MHKKTKAPKPTSTSAQATPAPQLPAPLIIDARYTIVKEDTARGIKYIEKPHAIQQAIKTRDLDSLIKFLKSDTPYDLNTIFYIPRDIASSCNSPDPFFIETSDPSAEELLDTSKKIKNFKFTLALSNPIFGLILTIHETFQQVLMGSKTQRSAEAYRDKAIEIIDLMISKGLNVNIPSIDGYTPLHFACGHGSSLTKVIEFLLTKGADVHARTITSEATPLHHLGYAPHETNALLLLKKGAELSATTKTGVTCARAICDVSREVAKKAAEYVIFERAKNFGYKAAFELLSKERGESTAIAVEEESFELIRDLKNVEEKYKVIIKIDLKELREIFITFTNQLNSKLNIKELQSLQKESWFFKEVKQLKDIFDNIDEKLSILNHLKECENELLQEVQVLFNLIAQLNQQRADKSEISSKISLIKEDLETKYTSLKKLCEDIEKIVNISFEISHITARIEHLNLRLKANKLGTISDDKTTEEAEASSSSDSDRETSAAKKEAEFDGRFSPENLRILADEFSNPASHFVSSVKEALYFIDSVEAEEIQANSKLMKILAKLKAHTSPHAKAIKYAQHYLPSSLLITFLEESDDRAFEDYLSATCEKSHFKAFAEAIESKGGTVEFQREWPKTGDFVGTLEKIISGNYINISRVEFTKLLQVLGFELTGFEEGNLRFHAIHHSGEKIGGHFIHAANVGRKGEVHIKTLQKLRGILEDDGTFEHYLEHHDAFSASAAGAPSASSSAAFASSAEELELDFVGSARGALAPSHLTTKEECLQLLAKILHKEPTDEDIRSLPSAYNILGRAMDHDLEEVIINAPRQLRLGNLRQELASILDYFGSTEGVPDAAPHHHDVSLAGAGGYGASESEKA